MVQYTKEKMHQWYLDHKAQHNENVKRWKREHPEYFKNRVQMSAKKFNSLPTVDDKLNYLTNYNLDVTDIKSQLPVKPDDDTNPAIEWAKAVKGLDKSEAVA